MNHLLDSIYGMREVIDLQARTQARAEATLLWWQVVAGLGLIAALGVALVSLRIARHQLKEARE